MDPKWLNDQRPVWEKVASSWHARHKRVFHPIVDLLASKWKPSILLDIGCGNGRNITPFAQAGFECFGLDFSLKLAKLAKPKYSGVVAADASHLPFKNSPFKYCLSIAVLHCIPSAEERFSALKELKRILKGKALLTVWKEGVGEQEKKWGAAKRYYYFYELGELKALVEKAGFEIDQDCSDERNFVLVLRS